MYIYSRIFTIILSSKYYIEMTMYIVIHISEIENLLFHSCSYRHGSIWGVTRQAIQYRFSPPLMNAFQQTGEIRVLHLIV